MKLIDRLLIGNDLGIREAERIFRKLFTSREQKPLFGKALLVLLRKKGEHANELVGLVRTIRKLEHPLTRPRFRYLADGCGTGGDGKQTFNISTIACLVAAGAGVRVAKHGNRSISSRCGSSDLMRALGVNIQASKQKMLKALRQCGYGYFHAPLYHPIFRRVQSLRMALGRKRIQTIFNLTGPLVNPLRPRRQLIGVFRKDLAFVMAKAVQKIGIERAWIVWNQDGYDELTTTARSSLIEVSPKGTRIRTISPSRFSLQRGRRQDLKGGNPKLNRAIAIKILQRGEDGTRRNTILLNAGAILYISGKAKNVREGIKLARKSIDSSAAWNVLRKLVVLTQ